jgi:uncharacterized protein
MWRMAIDVQDKLELDSSRFEYYLSQVRDILQNALADADVSCRVYLFGSRAKGTAYQGSDADIAVIADEDISLTLSRVRAILEESTIPYKIDLVDLNRTSPDFQEKVLADGVLIWKN